MASSIGGEGFVPSIKLHARVRRSRKNNSGGLVRADTFSTSISQDARSQSGPAMLRS